MNTKNTCQTKSLPSLNTGLLTSDDRLYSNNTLHKKQGIIQACCIVAPPDIAPNARNN